MSRMAKKYSSSRYSHTSLRRNSSHPQGGSMRTTAGALTCTCIGVADCEGALTVAIKLCATTSFCERAAETPSRLPEIPCAERALPGVYAELFSAHGVRAPIVSSFGRCRGLQFGALNRGDEKDNSPSVRPAGAAQR